jgi:DNA-binding CsgD family transcriptional regulator/tetratricopeptide (TPR) repeat protein
MARAPTGAMTATVGGLLERADQLTLLGELLEGVEETSRGCVALVGGEAGVGKTALIREFCADSSAYLLRGSCEPLFTPRPLGPLLEIAQESEGELAILLKRGAMPYEIVAALVEELRARTPAIFLLEDVHWADEATLDVLRMLVRRVETAQALVVATYRDDELDASHPLRIVLGELATSGAITRIRLPTLSTQAVAELAEPYGADAVELFDKTAGNPFFVVEALAAGGDSIPETVRDAVLARSLRLSAASRSVLDAVAVVPPQAELWLLKALVGELIGELDECLASGLLVSSPSAVTFRHDLARQAVEESIAPQRKIEFHRAALAALEAPPEGDPDLARLAHHADAAGDKNAVLRFAPAAAKEAAAAGAHREAAAQYARALRFGLDLAPTEKAELLESRSRECYLTDDIDEAIEAGQEELDLRRGCGERLEEGAALSWLSHILWCPGRSSESRRTREEAVAVLETLSPGRELALAWMNSWSLPDVTRAVELAVELGDIDAAIRTLSVLGNQRFMEGGRETIQQCIDLAKERGDDELVGWIYSHAIRTAIRARQYDTAADWAGRSLDHCSQRGLELYRFYALADKARVELDRGCWDEAAETASMILSIRRASIFPRIWGLVVLGLVRARRGDPGHRELVEEAWALGAPTDEVIRMGPAATARAEVAWLAGDRKGVAEATEQTFRLATEQKDEVALGELALWRRRAGIDDGVLPDAAEPFRSQLAGEWALAATVWDAAGCPYEAALARADSDDEKELRGALDVLHRLGAQPAAAIVAGRLRGRGARRLPRGPRRATRENPAGLTARQLEVLALVTEGMRDSEIAARLVLSERTVGHHVSAILRKLGVRNRGHAAAEAVRLDLVPQDR